MTTPVEVNDEIEKAKTFHPPLDQYLIMTTGKVRKEVHDLLIEINRKHRDSNLFTVQVFDWNRIEELLDEYPDGQDSYEGGQPAISVRRIESKLSVIFDHISEASGSEDSRDRFDIEIDEARDFLDKHEYQLGKLLLQRVKIRSWDKLSQRQKFRVLTNLAVVESSADNPKNAARLSLEAKRYQPADELARTNEAFAYLIIGERDQAFNLANELRKEFPRSPRVLEVFIRSAPNSMSLSSLTTLVPQDLLGMDAVAVALAEHAMDAGELEDAERLIRATTDAGTQSPTPWLLLGQIIAQSEITKRLRHRKTNTSSERLREAGYAFGQALERADERDSTSMKVDALLNRSRTRISLNENVEARDDLEIARCISPENTRVIEAYGDLLSIEGKYGEAIDLMRRVPENQLSDPGRLTLGTLLVERGNPGDNSIAEGLLSRIARRESELPPGFREYAIEVVFQSFSTHNGFELGHSLLEEVPQGILSEVAFKSLKAKLLSLEGRLEDASLYVDEALGVIDDTTTPFDIRRLATVFTVLGRLNDALPLWQKISLPDVLNEDTKNLMECASRLQRHDIMLDTFRTLREAGQLDRPLLDSELSLLEIYDTDAAISVLNQEIDRCPSDEELKLRRSILGLELDRTDLIDQDPLGVPTPDRVIPEIACDAVRVLREIGHAEYAVEYAYQVIRANFNNPDGHRAFLIALSPFGPEPLLETPERVESGVAVCYVEQGNSVPRWIILEELRDGTPPFPEPELPPDHEISRAIIGKKVGDTFFIARGIQDRIGTIVTIQNKYLYRYHDCLEQWQVRFPELPYLQAIRIRNNTADSGEAEPDFSAILKSVDVHHERVGRLEEIYKNELLPLHILGEQLSTNTFETLRHLALSSKMPIKCCIGSNEEREDAAKAFRACSTVVLDISAISSLVLLDRLEILECPLIDFVVSQSTVREIRQMIAEESSSHSKDSGIMLKTEIGHVFLEKTELQHKSYIKSLRHLVEVLEANCKIQSSKSLAAMDPEKREKIVALFGQYGAEAISLAASPGVTLWTDDHAQAMVARREHGVSRVWTQVIVQMCADLGILDAVVFLDVSAKLGGYGYYFTSQSPEVMRQAGIIAEWKMDAWPFSQALETFAEESVELERMLQLSAGFLRLLFQESILSQTKVNITVAILEQLSTRRGGLQGIQNLERALPQLFGLNAVGLMDAVDTIKAWRKGTSDRTWLV